MVVGHADRTSRGSHAQGHSEADPVSSGKPACCKCDTSVTATITILPHGPPHAALQSSPEGLKHIGCEANESTVPGMSLQLW